MTDTRDLGNWLATWASLQYHAQAGNFDNGQWITRFLHLHMHMQNEEPPAIRRKVPYGLCQSSRQMATTEM
jgi:hypothetical protein